MYQPQKRELKEQLLRMRYYIAERISEKREVSEAFYSLYFKMQDQYRTAKKADNHKPFDSGLVERLVA
jgi:hypothetical protein